MSKAKRETKRYRVIIRGDVEPVLKAFAYIQCHLSVVIIPHYETRKIDTFYSAKEITVDIKRMSTDDLVFMTNSITRSLFSEYSKIVQIEEV